MCLNEFTVALLILAWHALSFEVHMEVVGSAPREDRGRPEDPVFIYLLRKTQGDKRGGEERKRGGGVVELAVFVCIQTADIKKARLPTHKKSLVLLGEMHFCLFLKKYIFCEGTLQ